MALGTLSLSITTGRQGRSFQATVIGLTTGRVELGGDATPGFSFVNVVVSHPSLPSDRAVSTLSLIEYDPGATVSRKETRIEITTTPITQLNPLAVSIPTNITAAGSATISGSSGGALTLATNPDGAWSISGTTLSWTTAAIGKAGRPVIVETASQTLGLARQTALGGGAATISATFPPLGSNLSVADNKAALTARAAYIGAPDPFASSTPVQSLPVGTVIGAIGDSIIRRAFDDVTTITSTGEKSSQARSAIHWARKYNARFQHFAFYDATKTDGLGGPNRGVSGQTTTQIHARFQADMITALGSKIGALIYSAGVNDVQGTSGATNDATVSMSNIAADCNLWHTTFPNKPVFLETVRRKAAPGQGTAFSTIAGENDFFTALNQKIRAFAAANPSWVELVDSELVYLGADGNSDITKQEDGLHPNQVGASIEGILLDFAIGKRIASGTAIETGTNLLTALDMTTGGGTVSNGVTGAAANGSLITRTAGTGSTTAVASLISEVSQVAASERFGLVTPKQKIAFAVGGSIVETFYFTNAGQVFASYTVPNNAWVKMMMDVEADDYAWQYINLNFYRDNTTTLRSVALKGGLTLGFATRNYGGNFVFESEALPTAGTTFSGLWRLAAALDGNQGGAPSIKLSNPRLVQVADPATIVSP